MIVHICCSVDSWYFLTKLREKYPQELLTGFFYNPNIHPQNEYRTRLIDAKRSCDQLGISWIEGEYDLERWFAAASDLADEPEKGARCEVCFDLRLKRTAILAQELDEKQFTTTLLMSPKKDFIQLSKSANKIGNEYNLEFIFEDFRKGGGTQAQFALARQKDCYFQNYCGCCYALKKQRDQQGEFAHELSSPLDRIQDYTAARLAVYEQRYEMEFASKSAQIIKNKFLAYRLLSGSLTNENGETIDCEIAPYSVGKLNFIAELTPPSKSVMICAKKPLFVITKQFAGNNAREALELSAFDITPIFIVKTLPIGKVRIMLNAIVWEDVRENIVAKPKNLKANTDVSFHST
ncbi:hypothetical protein AGMMS49521_0530 [Campylobacterota bacterium]|nr:hypothetical protein AGMMS49521_0530 [Campylobacterota bacterium]